MDLELEARLRRLAPPEPPPEVWEEMVARVRRDYAEAVGAGRRWRQSAIVMGLALAACLAVLLCGRQGASPPPQLQSLERFDDLQEPDNGELIEELTPTELLRVERALGRGA